MDNMKMLGVISGDEADHILQICDTKKVWYFVGESMTHCGRKYDTLLYGGNNPCKKNIFQEFAKNLSPCHSIAGNADKHKGKREWHVAWTCHSTCHL